MILVAHYNAKSRFHDHLAFYVTCNPWTEHTSTISISVHAGISLYDTATPLRGHCRRRSKGMRRFLMLFACHQELRSLHSDVNRCRM